MVEYLLQDFLKGKIYQNYAELNIIGGNYTEALDNYDNATKLYQKIDNNLVYIKNLLSQFRLLIILGDSNVDLLYDNIKHLLKKSDLEDTFKTTIEIIDLFMNSLDDNYD